MMLLWGFILAPAMAGGDDPAGFLQGYCLRTHTSPHSGQSYEESILIKIDRNKVTIQGRDERNYYEAVLNGNRFEGVSIRNRRCHFVSGEFKANRTASGYFRSWDVFMPQEGLPFPFEAKPDPSPDAAQKWERIFTEWKRWSARNDFTPRQTDADAAQRRRARLETFERERDIVFSIKGFAVDAAGSRLPNVVFGAQVAAYEPDRPFGRSVSEFFATTDENGAFEFNNLKGYHLQIFHQSKMYQSFSKPFAGKTEILKAAGEPLKVVMLPPVKQK
jgi:hypothetical protein